MILFPDDISAIIKLFVQRARLDGQLVEECQPHIEHGQYADAVFKAFRVLEGRIQQRSGIQGESVGRTLDLALQSTGLLTRKLGLSGRQAANLRDLLKGAFAVFRNPEAHPGDSVIDYGSAQCQAVMAFVNLMLSVLDRQPDSPWEVALRQIRRDIGPDATLRLDEFLARVSELGVEKQARKCSYSFRVATGDGKYWTLFLLAFWAGNPCLRFTIYGWPHLTGFDPESFADALKSLGGEDPPRPREREIRFRLADQNSATFFGRLLGVVKEASSQIQAVQRANDIWWAFI